MGRSCDSSAFARTRRTASGTCAGFGTSAPARRSSAAFRVWASLPAELRRLLSPRTLEHVIDW
ncbi:hypothetical protein ACFHW2_25445 [Actinomadura sp. LOL_016]|uniref:hypothetical protein n=1 Tax=unclassified Actinomadura TaxID=2626254 RepID=UPI003A7F6C75